MAFLRFIQSPVGRAARVIGGLLLIAYGSVVLNLPGVVGMMAGVMSLVTGLAGLPHPPSPRNSRP